MRNLYIESKANTPEVSFNFQTGELRLNGRSIISDAEEFYNPVLSWLEEYSKEPAKNTLLKIDLQSFNIASSKRILFILYKMNELLEDGCKVKIQWHYSENEDEMYEVGQDYAFMVKVPFEFVTHETKLVASL
jgi:hypothetical protein